MRNLHPTRVFAVAAAFAAVLTVGALALQLSAPSGFAREASTLPNLGLAMGDPATGDPSAKLLPASGSFAPIVKAVAPAVVSITTARMVKTSDRSQPPFFFGPNTRPGPIEPGPRKRRGAGSGVVISAEGYVLTNHHVIEGATEIIVRLSDKREFEAEVVGADPQSDIALLRIPAQNLATVALGNSENVEVGDIVLALGNPFGIGQTVTMGIVGATGRGGLGIERYENFIQTDAAINPGNSGGALVNARGELIGINTAILSRGGGGNQGVGFAVPVNMAHHVMKQLAANGRVSRGYMGVGIQPVNSEIAEAFGVEAQGGALVSRVEPGSPAAEAGLRQGDIIRRVNGEEVDDPRTLSLKVAEQSPGSALKVAVLRDGREQTLSVKLAEHPEFSDATPPQAAPEGGSLGVGVQTLTPELAAELRLAAGTDGVVVARVDPGGSAAEAGIERGDVIEQIDRRKVETAEEFVALLNDNGRKSVLLLINRRGDSRFVVVKR